LAVPFQFAAVDYVLQEEVRHIWDPDSPEDAAAKVTVNVSSYIEDGLIRVIHLDHPKEELYFVNLASEMDDGEAVTGAISLHRGYPVATDDHKTRRVLSEILPSIQLLSTLDLLKLWGTSKPPAELRKAMNATWRGTGFYPEEHDALYPWWRFILS
jgi:hypothetical protein